MLVLTARPSDGPIHIIDGSGKQIGSIQLLGVKGNQCRYGFDFDDNIEIQRDVIYQRMIEEDNNG